MKHSDGVGEDIMGAKDLITKVPVPVCGLSLGLISLDIFLSANYEFYTFSIFALLSFIIAALFTIRIFVDRRGIIKDIENPAVFGVLPTYTMTLMLLSAFVKDTAGGIAGDISMVVWSSAIVMSFVIMFFFVRKFFLNFSIEKVFPSWIIIFVGYVVASVTSPVFGMEHIGQMIFWSGFIGYFALLPMIMYRILKLGIPESLVPNVAILAAPVNLCVVGCLSAYGDAPPEIALMILAVLGAISYVAVIGYLPVMLNRKFYPSFSGLTFPLVISAVSFYRLGEYYGLSSNDIFTVLQQTTVVIAIVIVAYVFIRYVMFFNRTARSKGA